MFIVLFLICNDALFSLAEDARNEDFSKPSLLRHRNTEDVGAEIAVVASVGMAMLINPLTMISCLKQWDSVPCLEEEFKAVLVTIAWTNCVCVRKEVNIRVKIAQDFQQISKNFKLTIL